VSVTDDVLTHAISELRKALKDDAREARFIETVPRRGYRLIAPVELTVADDAKQAAANATCTTTMAGTKRLHWWWTSAVAAVLLGIGWFWTHREISPVEQPLPQRSVLTSLPGNERSPRFSPDGNYVTFSWNGQGGDNWDIYVQTIDTRELIRRTDDPADDFNPAWSPDGRYIAFGRSDGKTERLLLIPQHGEREHVLITTPVRKPYLTFERRNFTSGWGPDGKWLVSSLPDENRGGLVRISVATGERKQLTTPSVGVWDSQPAVSPDGRSIIFVRQLNWSTKDLYLLRLSDSGEPRGEPERWTFANARLFSPVWSADGRSILYSYDGHLWQADFGTPGKGRQWMSWGGEPNASPDFDISHRTHRLVFEHGLQDRNIYQIEKSHSGKFGPPEKLHASTRKDWGAAYSPDGQKIAFSSERSGFIEVWIGDHKGSKAFQLTHFSGPIGGAPNWSPDGSRVAYDSGEEGASQIYVVSSTGGRATKLTHDTQSRMPRWSRDGQWIYFTSKAGLWKVPAGGGVPVLVVDNGLLGIESHDGQFFYFYRKGGVWRKPTNGRNEEFFLDTADFPGCFDVVEDGVFFLSERTPSGSSFLSFCSFASGKVEPVVEIGRPTAGLSATRDGRSILFAQVDQEASDLMLLENFAPLAERDSKRSRGSRAVTGFSLRMPWLRHYGFSNFFHCATYSSTFD
jgi:Tol biopolymer transport system component